MIKTALNTNILLLLKMMAALDKDLTAPTIFKTDFHSNNLLLQKIVSALAKDPVLAWFTGLPTMVILSPKSTFLGIFTPVCDMSGI